VGWARRHQAVWAGGRGTPGPPPATRGAGAPPHGHQQLRSARAAHPPKRHGLHEEAQAGRWARRAPTCPGGRGTRFTRRTRSCIPRVPRAPHPPHPACVRHGVAKECADRQRADGPSAFANYPLALSLSLSGGSIMRYTIRNNVCIYLRLASGNGLV